MQQLAENIDENGIEDEIQDKVKPAGRPRSESSRRAILDATRRLLTHSSVQKLSIEAIARKAGVGKTTIYRWWPNKAAVVMEAVFSQPAFHNVLPTPKSAAEGVHSQIDKLARQLSGKNGRTIAEIIGEAQPDGESLRILIQSFLQERYNSLSSYIEGGKQNGEFDPEIDTDSAIDIILGPLFFRLMSGQDMDEDFIAATSSMTLKALRA
ncbi:MAG: TetR/AcrR family transcriptional regulator [Alphaproteobacteria bacterium]|nr:TetR/AcrR family transcriptional regulator [Alphaproteobacteria bacterium]